MDSNWARNKLLESLIGEGYQANPKIGEETENKIFKVLEKLNINQVVQKLPPKFKEYSSRAVKHTLNILICQTLAPPLSWQAIYDGRIKGVPA